MNKSYYAIIPADVRYCKKITDGAKLLYGEITALCNEKGFCWASNSYFAELYNNSSDTISRWISSLKKEGFITIEIDAEKGNLRHIYLSAKMKTPIGKNADTLSAKMPIPIGKNDEHNNTFNNTFNNTNKVNEQKQKTTPHLFSESDLYLKSIINMEYYYEAMGEAYKVYDLDGYFEDALNWSESKGAKKINWLSTIKNFIRSDLKKGCAQMRKIERKAKDLNFD